MFSDCHQVGRGHVTALAVPISVGSVEVEIVVGIEAMHCVKLGELPKDFWSSFELVLWFNLMKLRSMNSDPRW